MHNNARHVCFTRHGRLFVFRCLRDEELSLEAHIYCLIPIDIRSMHSFLALSRLPSLIDADTSWIHTLPVE